MTVIWVLVGALFIALVWHVLSQPGGLARLGRAVIRMGQGVAIVYSPMAAAALYTAGEDAHWCAGDAGDPACDREHDPARDAEADLARRVVAGTLPVAEYQRHMTSLAVDDAVRHPLRLP